MRALLLALFLLILPTLPAVPQTEPVRILNQTELSAHSLFAVQTGRQDWGSNLLTRGPLQPGAELRLRPAQNTGCRFDLRMVLSDGREIINRSMDISRDFMFTTAGLRYDRQTENEPRATTTMTT